MLCTVDLTKRYSGLLVMMQGDCAMMLPNDVLAVHIIKRKARCHGRQENEDEDVHDLCGIVCRRIY